MKRIGEIFYGITKILVVMLAAFWIGIGVHEIAQHFNITGFVQTDYGRNLVRVATVIFTGMLLTGSALEHMFKNVPAFNAMVTINRITGHKNVYGEGWNVMWPKIEVFEENIPLKNLPLANWSMILSTADDDVKADGTTLVAPDPANLMPFVRLGKAGDREEKAKNLVGNKTKSLIEDQISDGTNSKTSEVVIDEGLKLTIQETRKDLVDYCKSIGLNLISVTPGNLDYSEAASLSRSAAKEQEKIHKIAKKIVEESNGAISWKEAYAHARVVTKNSRGEEINITAPPGTTVVLGGHGGGGRT